jgi:ribosomal protein S21
MVEVRRRPSETTGAMLRRFTRRVQQSGILLRARRERFYKSKLTKRQKRERALRRIALLKERTRLEKLGKLEKEENQ